MIEVSASPRRQEVASPEVNRVESFDGLFYLVGKVTHKSLADKREGIQRSLQLRTTRAQILKEFRQTPKADTESRHQLIQEAKTRNELEIQYLNQGEVTVDLPGLGPQTARYTIIDLPENLKPAAEAEKPPIFFIPGLSNDLDCVKATLQELAYSGRRVIAVGFPESFMGKITPEFAQASEQSLDLEPHTTFFKEAANKLIGTDAEIEFWGHSTGATIIEQILADANFQQRTTNAVLLCPAASADISTIQAVKAFAKEIAHLGRRFGQFPRFSYTRAAKEGEAEGQRELKVKVFKALTKRVLSESDFTKDARVQEGGKIVVVSGNRDNVTRSSTAKDRFLTNPQVDFIELPNGYHFTPLTEPGRAISLVKQHLQK